MSTADHVPFVHEIIAAPDDDAPRLIYADWLEEHGDLRGEFIRVQCEKDRLPWHEPRYIELEEREQAILAVHNGKWTKELPRAKDCSWSIAPSNVSNHLVWKNILFRRGFAEVGGAKTVKALLDAQTLLLGETLLRELRVLDLSPKLLERLLQSPWGERIRGLYFHQLPESLQIVAQSAIRERLHSLSFAECAIASYHAPEHRLHELTDRDWPGLRWLNLDFNAFRRTHLEQIAAWPGAPNLQALNLGLNPLGADIAPLLQSKWLKNIHLLDFWNTGLEDSSLAEMAAAKLEQLTHLSVADNKSTYRGNVTGVGISALFRNSPLPSLRVFTCEQTGFDDEAALVLAESPQFGNLRAFHVGQTALTGPGLSALVRSPFAANLRRLSIRRTMIGDEAVSALVESPSLTKLEYLNIGQTNFSDDGRAKLKKRFKKGLVEKPYGP